MGQEFEERVSYSESATRFYRQQISDTAPTMDNSDNYAMRRKVYRDKPAFFISAMAGGIAGIIVDISLYPLDTFKTRLQSKEGFRASGGFKGIYKGIIPVLMFSAPVSAIFFVTYNTLINTIRTQNSIISPFAVFVAASLAEIVCSTVRVPMEIVKQRRQTTNARNFQIIKNIAKSEGSYGFYRGFWSTLLREIPFSAIQYPLWEHLMYRLLVHKDSRELTPFETALCGASAGAVAAVLTTPMDVVKTRLMLAEKEKIENYRRNLNVNMAKEVYRDRGIRGFFSGLLPRVLWITLGGFIYFGAYDKAKNVCEKFSKSYMAHHQPEHEDHYIVTETVEEDKFLSPEAEIVIEETEEEDTEDIKNLVGGG